MRPTPPQPVLPVAMSRTRFTALLKAYGPNASRWPPAERQSARALIAGDETAAAEWQRAKTLDGLLEALPSVATSAEERRDAAIVGRAAAQGVMQKLRGMFRRSA